MMGASRALSRSGDGWNHAEATVATMHDASDDDAPLSPILSDAWPTSTAQSRISARDIDVDMLASQDSTSGRRLEQRIFFDTPSESDWRLSAAATHATQDRMLV